MVEQLAIQNLLRKKYSEIKAKNPSYSIRSFATKLKIGSGPLSTILNGKRFISRSMAEKFAEQLCLDPQERSEILRLFPEKRRYNKEATETTASLASSYIALSAAQFRVVSEWQHFAILSLIKTKDFKNDPKWISDRLGISVSTVKQAITRLLDTKLIKKTEDGTLARTTARFRTSDDIANLSIKKSHEETLEMAKEKLYELDVTKRDFSHITLAINPEQLPKAKTLIREFQDKLTELLETGPRSEVYRFFTQLFPLTNLEEKQEK